MTKQEVIIIGIGAQAKYAVETFRLQRVPVRGVLLIENNAQIGDELYGVKVLGSLDDFEKFHTSTDKPQLLLACSKNHIKEELVKKLSVYSPKYANAIHPTAVVATTAILGEGVIINANAVIQPFAQVGSHVMVHAGVIIEHDCIIDDFVNLAPRATLAGHAKVGRGSYVCAGAVVAPTVRIGKCVTIGAGAVVLKDIPDNKVAVGIPAQPVVIKK